MAKYVHLCILHNSPFGVKGIYHAFCCLILSYFIKCLNLLSKENKHTYSYHSLIFLFLAKLILFEHLYFDIFITTAFLVIKNRPFSALFSLFHPASTSDTIDWKEERSARTILDTVIPKLHPGCIILCHNNGYKIKEYLPTLIKTAQEQGYEFVTVSELLLTGDTMIDVNGVQKLK